MMIDEKPRFTMRNVDVMQLQPATKTMSLRIHVVCSEFELKSDETVKKVNDSVKWAVDYLYREGFIAQVSGWHVNVGVHGHKPKD